MSETVRIVRCDAMTDVAYDGTLWCWLPMGHDGPHDDGDILWALKPEE